VGLMIESAKELGVPVPLTAITQQMLQAALAEGLGEDDMCSSIKVLEKWAGVEVKKD
jgi:3-hydroxyisobutyrate dehydrogenase-like beta-hydroxyacid dehydrogenase